MARWDLLPQDTIDYILWLRREMQWKFRIDRLIRRLLRAFGFGVQRLTQVDDNYHPGWLAPNAWLTPDYVPDYYNSWLSPNLSQYMHFM